MLYLSYLSTDFDEFLHVEIIWITWKARKISAGSPRLQGQRLQGLKGQNKKFPKMNFQTILGIFVLH